MADRGKTMDRRQRGMTLIGWLIVLGLIAFFSLLAIRLVPVYLDNYKVRGTLASLKEEPYITQKAPEEIRRLIERRLDINMVETVQAKDFKIERKDGRTAVYTEYEVQRPFLGNVSLLVRFNNRVEMVAP
jgi:Tfp pilus assembly major pilin PilA